MSASQAGRCSLYHVLGESELKLVCTAIGIQKYSICCSVHFLPRALTLILLPGPHIPPQRLCSCCFPSLAVRANKSRPCMKPAPTLCALSRRPGGACKARPLSGIGVILNAPMIVHSVVGQSSRARSKDRSGSSLSILMVDSRRSS
jgi:hypothetical protein